MRVRGAALCAVMLSTALIRQLSMNYFSSLSLHQVGNVEVLPVLGTNCWPIDPALIILTSCVTAAVIQVNQHPFLAVINLVLSLGCWFLSVAICQHIGAVAFSHRIPCWACNCTLPIVFLISYSQCASWHSYQCFEHKPAISIAIAIAFIGFRLSAIWEVAILWLPEPLISCKQDWWAITSRCSWTGYWRSRRWRRR